MKTRLLALALLVPALTFADFSLSIHIGPPALPVYTQPPCPADGYIWTPGYWAYGPYGYYWVPGVWVAPPRVGVLWTPGYWGFVGGLYSWHAGYWGPHVGFYGGVNYGFGYHGTGFEGGGWAGNVYRYNTAVTNVNTTVVKNVYVNKTVINNNTVVNNRASFNGPGGATAQPTPQQQAFAREQHIGATQNQLSHQETAGRDRTQLASVNRGVPQNAAMDSVNGRRFNQQGRIANGIASNQITPAEGKRLENRQANINREVRNDRAANGGQLTPGQRAQVNAQQNKTSQAINQDKHNAATSTYNNSAVDRREQRQQDRVAQGVNNGTMKAGEAARAERQQQHVTNEVNRDRQANGGRLNEPEKARIEHQQNKASREIHEEKHNERH